MTNWYILFSALIAIAAIVLAYLQVRKPRWPKYRCRGLPYERIFRGGEYGYDPQTFLEDVASVDLALEKLRTWYADGTKPLLIKGATG